MRVILFVLFDARATETDKTDFGGGGGGHGEPRTARAVMITALVKKCAILPAGPPIGQPWLGLPGSVDAPSPDVGEGAVRGVTCAQA